jgi:hypothetical protein
MFNRGSIDDELCRGIETGQKCWRHSFLQGPRSYMILNAKIALTDVKVAVYKILDNDPSCKYLLLFLYRLLSSQELSHLMI